MPPKFKFTREQIIDAALNIARGSGIEALTARALAAELGSSAKPIFGLFENMEEVHREVFAAAKSLYDSYIQKSMSCGEYPPYKASGMGYILFAREEKELFKLLFMRDRSGEEISDGREELRPITEIIMANLNIGEDEALLFHRQVWIYVHGIATMLATGFLDWDTEFISRSLTDAYQGFKHRYCDVLGE